MSGTENLANYQWLMKPWTLEDNLLLPFFLNQYSLKLNPKYLSLYPQLTVAFTARQSSSFLQKTEATLADHNQ